MGLGFVPFCPSTGRPHPVIGMWKSGKPDPFQDLLPQTCYYCQAGPKPAQTWGVKWGHMVPPLVYLHTLPLIYTDTLHKCVILMSLGMILAPELRGWAQTLLSRAHLCGLLSCWSWRTITVIDFRLLVCPVPSTCSSIPSTSILLCDRSRILSAVFQGTG